MVPIKVCCRIVPLGKAPILDRKMINYVSYLLAANAAKRRLAELFESETLGSPDYSSTPIVLGESNRAVRTNVEQNNNLVREYSSSKRWPVSGRVTTAIPTKKTKRDLTVSGLVLALLHSGAVVAAHTDQPVFWLLVGPAPFAVAYTVGTFLRHRLILREGLLVFRERYR